MSRKLVGIWYDDYGAGRLPADPKIAATRIYVRVGDENSTTFNFHYEYAIRLMTLGYLQTYKLPTNDGYENVRSLLIVERFDYDLIEKAVNAILPNIEFYGTDIS